MRRNDDDDDEDGRTSILKKKCRGSGLVWSSDGGPRWILWMDVISTVLFGSV